MTSYSSEIEIPKSTKSIFGLPILPVNQTHPYSPKVLSSLLTSSSDKNEDIIDESIRLFRANVFLKSFNINNPTDRTLSFLTVFINHFLKALRKYFDRGQLRTRKDAQNIVTRLFNVAESIPGESTFSINSVFLTEDNIKEEDKELMRDYLKLLKLESANRIVEKIWDDERLRKHWLGLGNLSFMNVSSMKMDI